MAFAALEDYNGEIELTFFSGCWKKYQDKIETDKVTILKGKLEYQKEKDKRSFTVDEYLEVDDLERAVKEEEAQARKWDKYRNVWRFAKDLELSFPDLANAARTEPGTYTIIGVIKSLRTHIDSKGKEMAFGSIQDQKGEIDIVFFARTWENCKALVSVDEILALKGSIDPSKDKNPAKPSFLVSSVQDLTRLLRAAAKKAAESDADISTDTSTNAAAEAAVEAPLEKPDNTLPLPHREVHIRLAARAANDEAVLYSLKACMDGNPGNCPVYIHIPVSCSDGAAKETVIRTAAQINAGASASMGALAECAAVADVWGADGA